MQIARLSASKRVRPDRGRPANFHHLLISVHWIPGFRRPLHCDERRPRVGFISDRNPAFNPTPNAGKWDRDPQ